MLSLPTAIAQTASAPLTVVELFTSQGCSSCPPADALLGEMAHRPGVLALAYHVDYWDGLGWRDRFAIPEAALRQRRYVSALGLFGAFTPQSVVDGRISLVGSDRRNLSTAIAAAHSAIPIKLAISNRELVIGLDDAPSTSHLDVSVVAYLSAAATVIPKGENAGRTLKEFNIVRAIRHLGTWDGKAHTFSVPIAALPEDAGQVAVLLQQPQQGHIVGAASISLR